jgi:hypothetical protein
VFIQYWSSSEELDSIALEDRHAPVLAGGGSLDTISLGAFTIGKHLMGKRGEAFLPIGPIPVIYHLIYTCEDLI